MIWKVIIELNCVVLCCVVLCCVVMEMEKREWKGDRKRRKGESCNRVIVVMLDG